MAFIQSHCRRWCRFCCYNSQNSIFFWFDSEKEEQVQVQLEIKVINVDYAKDCSTIRVRGRTITSNEYVSSGSFHTLELETNRELKLTKNPWDEKTIKILEEGLNQNGQYDLGIIIINNTSAEILLTDNNTTSITHCATIRIE